MIEYLYDRIRALAGNDLIISAAITDSDGKDIASDVSLVLHDKDRETMLYSVAGTYDKEIKETTFTILKEITEGNKTGVIKDIINPGYYVYEIEIDNTLYYVNDVHIVNKSKEV